MTTPTTSPRHAFSWPAAARVRTAPIRPAVGIPSPCPLEDDYLAHLRRRQTHWLNTTYVLERHLWQRAIDDKLLGYMFARSVGVATPSVLFCDPRGPQYLPEVFPESWGCCFAIKPLYGYNDFGVMLVEHGVDRFSGTRLGGREDVLEHLRNQGVPRLHRSTVYVETLVRPEQSIYGANETPPDFKFLTFGSRVASVAIIQGRKTSGACMAWVDADYRRTDKHGCICKEVHSLSPCSYAHCDKGRPTQPSQWGRMVETASKLGAHIGLHMRIDLYAARNGVPVLGEFTPWHANGRMHCHMTPLNDSQRARVAPWRKDGLTGKRHQVDACLLGRLWKEHGGDLGRNFNPQPPPVMRGWAALMYNERAKCLAATRLLTPSRRARARMRRFHEDREHHGHANGKDRPRHAQRGASAS